MRAGPLGNNRCALDGFGDEGLDVRPPEVEGHRVEPARAAVVTPGGVPSMSAPSPLLPETNRTKQISMTLSIISVKLLLSALTSISLAIQISLSVVLPT